jgi:hypothetical protein
VTLSAYFANCTGRRKTKARRRYSGRRESVTQEQIKYDIRKAVWYLNKWLELDGKREVLTNETD